MSDVKYAHCLYISYAYDVPENDALLAGLEGICRKESYTFKCDKEAVREGDSFKAFMKEMGEADQVVVIVSDQYFESYYCLHELTEISRSGGLKGRVIPVWIKSLSGKPDHGVFQHEVRAFWESVRDNPDQSSESGAATVEDISSLLEQLPLALSELGELKALYFDPESSPQEQGQFFSKLRRRVLYPISRTDVKAIVNRKGDEQFKKAITTKVQDILDACPAILEPLRNVAGQTGSAGIAEYLCDSGEQDVCAVLEDDLFPAIQSVDARQRDADFIDKIKELASTLALLAVEDGWLELWDGETSLNNMRVNLELSAASALIVTSRLHQKFPRFGYKKGNAGLWGCDQLELPGRQASWNSRQVVENIVLKIWTEVFPETALEKLDEKAINTLNKRLRNYYQRGFRQHYICSEGNENAYLLDSNVLHGLQKYLPALLILVLENPQGNTTVALQNDGELVDALRDFLTDLDDL